MTRDDQSWVHELGKRRYPTRFDDFTAMNWLLNTVLTNPLVYFPVRTDNAFIIGHMIAHAVYGQEIIVDIEMICADEGALWEAACLLEASKRWGKFRNAKLWQITSETYDLRPLAFRVGAKEVIPRYRMEL